MKLEVESSTRFKRLFSGRKKRLLIPIFFLLATALGFGAYVAVRAITSSGDSTNISIANNYRRYTYDSNAIYYGVNESVTWKPWSTRWYDVNGHDAMCLQASKLSPSGSGTAHLNTTDVKRIMLATVPSYSTASVNAGGPNYYNLFNSYYNWSSKTSSIRNLMTRDTNIVYSSNDSRANVNNNGEEIVKYTDYYYGCSHYYSTSCNMSLSASQVDSRDAIFALGHMAASGVYANDYYALNSSDISVVQGVISDINSWFNANYPNAADEYEAYTTWVDSTSQTIGWLEYKGKPSAKLKIVKVDNNSNRITATAAFRVCEVQGGSDVNCQGPFQTSNGETATITVNSETIHIYETTVPSGYKCTDNDNNGSCDVITKTVTLGNTSTVTFNVANTPVNSVYVKINKVDAEKLSANPRGTASVQNAVYGVYNSAGSRVATITIGSNGIGTSNNKIPEGNGYYIVEDTASPSYTKNTSQRITFNVTPSTSSPIDFTSSSSACSSSSTSACYFTDTIIKGKVKVTKQRSSYGASNSAYANIIFDIVNKNDPSEKGTMTTDANGVAVSGDLIYGQYTATERRTNANQAYSMISFDFTISSNGTTVDAGTKVNTVPDNPKIATVARNSNSSVSDPDKELEISGNASVTDHITCSGLEGGKQYRFDGEIWYLEGNSKINSTGTHTFTTDSSGNCGSIDMVFSPIDTSDYIDKKFGIKQYLYKYNGPNDWVLVAIHNNDLTNTDEQIKVKDIQIETTANSERTNNKELAAGKVKIKDTYQIIGMTNGLSYIMEGAVKDQNGNTVATAQHNITMNLATGAPYTDVMDFQFDSTPYVGQNLYVVQTLKDSTGKTLAVHNAPSDGSQTVSVLTPKLYTNAVNGRDTAIKELEVGMTTIQDTVTYEGLVSGDAYTIKGEVWKLKADGTKDVRVSTATHSFTASGENDTSTGEVLSFNIDTIANCSANNKLVLPCKFVIFEYIYYGNNTNPFSRHEDVADNKQIVSVKKPTLATDVSDEQNDTETLPTGTTTVMDRVTYDGLVPNQTYIVKGKLVNTSDGSAVKDATGADITGIESFPAAGVTGTVVMDSFNKFDTVLQYDYSLGENQKQYTVFQTLYYGDIELATHEDLTDADQTIRIGVPKIATSATYKLDGTRLLGVGDIVMKDYVDYEGLVEGEWYMIEGMMIDPETGNILEIDDEFIRNTKTFKADKDGKGTVSLEINLNTISIQGKSYVVYERLYRSQDKHGDGRILATHEDLNDENQTVTVKVAKIETMATDKSDGDNILDYQDGQMITDTVSYDGLLLDEEYILYGYLFNKTTGTKLLDKNGNEISATAAFTTSKKKDNGEIIMEFPVDAADLPGVEIVVFEYLYQGDSVEDGTLITKHEDPDDANQTVRVNMRVGTTASDKYDGDQIIGVGKVTVVDNLQYEGAVNGKTYKAVGRLVFQDTGEQVQGVTVTDPIVDDEEGDDTGEEDGGDTEGDPEDGDAGEDEEGSEEEGDDTETDEPMPKIRTHEDIVQEKTFVIGSEDAYGTNGTVTLEFEFDSRELIGKKLVVYEELYLIKDNGEEELVASHKDLNDSAQTVTVATPSIHTVAVDKLDEDKELSNEGRVIILDKVEYKGLVAGTTYTLHGTLVDKDSGEILVVDGITDATWEFTPTRSDGTETLEFEIDTEGLDGMEIVVFEDLYIDSNPEEDDKIASHKDLNDGNQTVWVKSNVPNTGLFTRTIDGARRTGALYAMITIAVISVTSLVVIRTVKRKRVTLTTKR